MIVVTGATGNVGRPLIQSLAAAGEQVTAVSRRISDLPNDVPNGVPKGVRRLQADLSQPETLEPALHGAKAVFLLTAAEFLANGNMKDVMEVVEASGVERVVLLSSQGVGTKRHPSDLEDAVTQSGLGWTMLRPGNFASNAFQWPSRSALSGRWRPRSPTSLCRPSILMTSPRSPPLRSATRVTPATSTR